MSHFQIIDITNESVPKEKIPGIVFNNKLNFKSFKKYMEKG